MPPRSRSSQSRGAQPPRPPRPPVAVARRPSSRCSVLASASSSWCKAQRRKPYPLGAGEVTQYAHAVQSADTREPAPERRTSPVELLWDLVFVFAVTQVTTLLRSDLTWAGLGRSMLVLALVWWAWSAFVWATNAQDPGAAAFRGVL